ncbi:MAG: NADP-dependent oxidoreductase [Thiothrix sp.]|nr:MAG: NADP-dependent oxidoreductase [Thiothrix sp.]
MQAIQLVKYSKKQPQISLNQVEPAAPKAGQVAIRVHCASLNPVDLKLTEGFPFALQKPPFTLGVDGSGIIEQIGQGEAELKVGDEVFFYTPFSETGSWAERLVIDAHCVAKKPKSLSLTESGAMSLVALTGFTAMQKLQIKPHDKILIHGVAGGVGLMAAQIAKAQGAYVIGTARRDQTAVLQNYSVDQVLDYREDNFTQLLNHIDGALDTVHDNGKTLQKTLSVMNRGGRVVSLSMPNLEDMVHLKAHLPAPLAWLIKLMNKKYFKQAQSLGVTLMPQATYPNRAQMQRLTTFIDQHGLKVPVQKSFSLNDYAVAISALKTNKAMGKLLFTLN